jgi:hypothetical protein
MLIPKVTLPDSRNKREKSQFSYSTAWYSKIREKRANSFQILLFRERSEIREKRANKPEDKNTDRTNIRPTLPPSQREQSTQTCARP